jgi:hypothetical protein
LERGITNLIAGKTDPADTEKEIVQRLYNHTLVNGYGQDEKKPSYLASRSFRNALLDITHLLDATSDGADDPVRVDEIRRNVEERIEAIPSDPLRTSLTAIWRSVDRDATEFRAGVERWFDRGMERVTGWYKRRTMLTLFLIGIVVTVGLNAGTLTTASRLWRTTASVRGSLRRSSTNRRRSAGPRPWIGSRSCSSLSVGRS